VCRRFIRNISIHRRSGWTIDAGCRPRSASDVPQTCLYGCSVVNQVICGQVGCSSRQHCESAVCRRLIRVISIRRRCGSSGVAVDMKVLGVVLDRRLTFHKHVSIVPRSCNYHAQVIRHIRHLLTTELAQTLACSLILSRIDYCNAVLHGALTGTIQKLQRVQNNAARIVFQASRRSHAKVYCTSCIGCQSSSGSHTSWQF